MALFQDRVEAGRRLGERLGHLRGTPVVVLGLPRGGVPVAYQVAEALRAPLDVIVVRKLGVPAQPELAMGAIGEDGARVLEDRVLGAGRISEAELEAVEQRERQVLSARTALFRSGRGRRDLEGKAALIVDDGMATGATARAACKVARALRAASVIFAVPVAPAAALRRLDEADEVFCLASPRFFRSVGEHYRDFSPTTENEVVALLDAARSLEHRWTAEQDGSR